MFIAALLNNATKGLDDEEAAMQVVRSEAMVTLQQITPEFNDPDLAKEHVKALVLDDANANDGASLDKTAAAVAAANAIAKNAKAGKHGYLAAFQGTKVGKGFIRKKLPNKLRI